MVPATRLLRQPIVCHKSGQPGDFVQTYLHLSIRQSFVFYVHIVYGQIYEVEYLLLM